MHLRELLRQYRVAGEFAFVVNRLAKAVHHPSEPLIANQHPLLFIGGVNARARHQAGRLFEGH
ncbi:hypothetical protein D3C72_686300 [compost metagenome]